MTTFTEGRLQMYERMMRETGERARNYDGAYPRQNAQPRTSSGMRFGSLKPSASAAGSKGR